MHRLAILAGALALGCAAPPGQEPEPLAPEHTTQSIPAIDAELVGLCVNANFAEQRPEVSALCELSPTWIRSIVNFDGHARTFELLKAYRTRGERNPKVLALINQETVGIPAPASPFGGDDKCDFTRPVPAEELARFEEQVAAYGPAFGDVARAMIGNYGDAFDAVELFNEPDGIAGGCLRAKDYASILIAVIPRVEGMLVGKPYTLGATITDGWRSYMTEVVDTLYDAGIDYDAFSFHPYVHFIEDAKGKCPTDWAALGRLDYDLANGGSESAFGIANRHARPDGSKHRLWITEFGYPLEVTDASCSPAEYLTRAFRQMNSLRDEDGHRLIEHAFWFAWDDRTHYEAGTRFGLVDRDHRPRAAGNAFANLVRSYDACPLSCRTASKCENDLPPNEIDTAACEAAAATGAKCATEARNLMECTVASQQCEAGYTTSDVRKFACETEKAKLAACRAE